MNNSQSEASIFRNRSGRDANRERIFKDFPARVSSVKAAQTSGVARVGHKATLGHKIRAVIEEIVMYDIRFINRTEEHGMVRA